jgi:RNA polymerase sigma factor (sigma-70 family)
MTWYLSCFLLYATHGNSVSTSIFGATSAVGACISTLLTLALYGKSSGILFNSASASIYRAISFSYRFFRCHLQGIQNIVCLTHCKCTVSYVLFKPLYKVLDNLVLLAVACGVTVEDAAVALETVNPISSLSETYGDDEKLTLESQLASTDCEIERLTDKIALGQAIGRLPREWQKIITLRYFRNMTQQQVADALGLSQVKVSREEKKILAALREELNVG